MSSNPELVLEGFLRVGGDQAGDRPMAGPGRIAQHVGGHPLCELLHLLEGRLIDVAIPQRGMNGTTRLSVSSASRSATRSWLQSATQTAAPELPGSN